MKVVFIVIITILLTGVIEYKIIEKNLLAGVMKNLLAGVIEKKNVKKLEDQNKNLQDKLKSYVLRDERIKCMKKTIMLSYGLSKWEAHYYSVIMDDFATNYCIPWEIYAAIIRVESNFNGTLISPQKAKGLMQILESTGKGEAALIGSDFVEGQTLWNDISNMILGCNYLSRLIKNTNLESGVKSYLGGPGYLTTIKYNQKAGEYISEYKTSVWKEYKQLVYVYRGIVSEFGTVDYNEIHHPAYVDSIIINTEIFDSMKASVKPDTIRQDSLFKK